MRNNKLPKTLQTASKDTSWLQKVEQDKANEAWMDLSFEITLRVHAKLKEAGMTQKQLAQEMGVSAQYVGKLLKGKENLTLQQITRLEAVLQIKLIQIPDSFSRALAMKLFELAHLVVTKERSKSVPEFVSSAGESNYAMCA